MIDLAMLHNLSLHTLRPQTCMQAVAAVMVDLAILHVTTASMHDAALCISKQAS